MTRRLLIAAGVTAIAAASTIANWAALGGRATGARLRRMKKSPEWQGSHFENPQPIVNDNRAAIVSLFRPDRNVTPQSPPSTVPVDPARFVTGTDVRAVDIQHAVDPIGQQAVARGFHDGVVEALPIGRK